MSLRRYKIESVIGQGGFGRVYRAVLEADGGFRKRVAVKVLSGDTDQNLPNLMERFRDEARILGLIQDRAFVSVEPPVRLNGRWAVVMEYAEGESAKALLRHGGFPPSCALEIVMEVARALSTAYWKPGEDGEPLRLLHRDLKPANLQISASGEVRLLDFGIAKAQFGEREALTTNDWAGTAGYSAPERLEGEDGPEGDVYSLGVVLQVLITRDTPLGAGQFKEKNHRTESMGPGLELARKMYDLDPKARPRMRSVEQMCRELLRRSPPPTLREWAESKVELGRGEKQDESCGSVWIEGESPDGQVRQLSRLDGAGSATQTGVSSDTLNTLNTADTGDTSNTSNTLNTGKTPPSGRMLPYTMGRMKGGKPLRERLAGDTPVPEYADQTEILKRAEARLEASKKDAERKAAEEAEKRRLELERPPATPAERLTAFARTPSGMAALIGGGVFTLLFGMLAVGTFSVHEASDTSAAATEAYLQEVEESGRDLAQSLVSLGSDPAAVTALYDAFRHSRDPAEKLQAADAFVDWSIGETKQRLVAAGNSLQSSTASAHEQRLVEARGRVEAANAAWDHASSSMSGGLAVALHLASRR
jgi:serine/threonine protein kinase